MDSSARVRVRACVCVCVCVRARARARSRVRVNCCLFTDSDNFDEKLSYRLRFNPIENISTVCKL